ncbi:RecX family transcriptional regulator [Kineococcus sp. T13]|nr:regulatory protein RecX [Kineococcus vitellinus]NAZ74761.1 RecX family transcriptional regulator [Kineococcus vitellinus]
MAPRSRAQLAQKMAAKDVPEQVAQDVLDRFEEVGLVDDRSFAQSWVHSRQGHRGRRALALELRRKGIADETAQDALEEVDDSIEEQAARTLLRRPLAATRGMDAVKRQRRLAGVLARRGFPPGLVMRLVREELAADTPDDTADDTADGAEPQG